MVNVRSSECHFKSVYIYIYLYFKSWCLILTGIMLLWTTEVNYQWGEKKIFSICSLLHSPKGSSVVQDLFNNVGMS